MNDDLISRSALLQTISETIVISARETGSAEARGIRKVLDRIEAAPAVDAVEVVRCKDCKFWDCGDCYRLELSRPTDFCSYGERKNNWRQTHNLHARALDKLKNMEEGHG